MGGEFVRGVLYICSKSGLYFNVSTGCIDWMAITMDHQEIVGKDKDYIDNDRFGLELYSMRICLIELCMS